ncbi:NEDD4-binding protein 3-A [Sardina pilchardus]|uniref:NEDD4-binding protein 3-A n=1 Tax=Sardina pilchardus TaxID=27697 RepID=UPI002E134D31
MATVQALSLTRDTSKSFGGDLYSALPLASARCIMGSVGSLIERPDVSPTKGSRAMPQVPPRHGNGLLKKGFNQRELLNYLNIAKKEPKGGKHIISSGVSSIKREHGREEENLYAKVYHKGGKEVDVSKNSLPMGGKFDKSRLRPSAFKPVTPKNFSSMQNLYPAQDASDTAAVPPAPSNGMRPSYITTATSKSLSSATSSSSSSPSRHHGNGKAHPPHPHPHQHQQQHPQQTPGRHLSQEEEENASDSGHHSLSSLLPPYRPAAFRPHLGHISVSMGHIDHIGSLDRHSANGGSGSRGALSSSSAAATEASLPPSGTAATTLGRLRGYGSEAPPPYELSMSMEDVVRDLEERLVEKDHELRQMRRNLDESEDAIAQVFEEKQRLWEREVEELKRLYAAKLRQVSQQAQRAQRGLQLQLYKAQQERARLQQESEALRTECQSLRRTGGGGGAGGGGGGGGGGVLEETQWEVCQKSGEISLLKQQLRDSQAEVARKLSEIFQLKTELRQSRADARNKDGQVEALQLALQAATARRKTAAAADHRGGSEETVVTMPSGSPGSGATEDRLRAELLLERRQNEAQVTAFEAERHTWQTEKEKVIRYQRELQASYLEMYHKSEALERELLELRGGQGASGGGGVTATLKQPLQNCE